MRLKEQLRNIELTDFQVACFVIVAVAIMGAGFYTLISDPSPRNLDKLVMRHYELNSNKWDQLSAILEQYENIVKAQQAQINALDKKLRDLEKAIVRGFLVNATHEYVVEERIVKNESSSECNRVPFDNSPGERSGVGLSE